MKRQDALTSKQVPLIPRPRKARPADRVHPEPWLGVPMSQARKLGLVMLVVLAAFAAVGVPGCTTTNQRAAQLQGPYETRQLFAVAPLNNESGSAHADGVRLADRLSEQFTVAGQIDTVPVNRVLAAMDRIGLSAVTSKSQALQLRQALGVDGLLVGTVTSYDPYDPPKLGLNVELYLDPKHASSRFDIRKLSRAASDRDFRFEGYSANDQPVSTLSSFFDAAAPYIQDAMRRYAVHRGVDYAATSADARLYRISADLYADFVANEICRRLLLAESQRIVRSDDARRAAQQNQANENPPPPTFTQASR
ncbi:MAG: hypothetical protein AAGF84_10090 [Planctomycetota bacterium]